MRDTPTLPSNAPPNARQPAALPATACPFCGTLAEPAGRTCGGCNARILIGATTDELRRALKVGAAVSLLPALILFGRLASAGTRSWIVVVLSLVIVGLGGLGLRLLQMRKLAGHVRFLRWTKA